MLFNKAKTTLVDPEDALPGRDQPISVPERHEVLGNPLTPPFPEGIEQIVFGMGCFWGAERLFWQADGVWTTAVGYAGGFTPNPTYEEVCSARPATPRPCSSSSTPRKTSYDEMLQLFWEGHDPTQGMRQGNDVGTQYRSAIYCRTTRPARGRRGVARRLRRARWPPPATARSRPRSRPLGTSTTPRTTTSSTWPRSRTATAASAAPA